MDNKEFEINILTGRDLTKYLDDLANLRIEVFREYPYLYDGSIEYEINYLSSYLNNDKSLFVAAVVDGKVIGMSTGTPLTSEPDSFQQEFTKKGMDPGQVFYFGESVLKKEFRGLGIGKKFMELRINHAINNHFSVCAFCEVFRPANHYLKPDDYKPLDLFWQMYGFDKELHMSTTIAWKDLGQDKETDKEMIFWIKKLSSIIKKPSNLICLG